MTVNRFEIFTIARISLLALSIKHVKNKDVVIRGIRKPCDSSRIGYDEVRMDSGTAY